MRSVIVVSLFAASVAHADPRPTVAFVGVGATVGGDNAADTGNLGIAVEGGVDLYGPLWAHAQAAAGVALAGFTGGGFFQLRGGVEGRYCGASTCGTYGLDLGYQVETTGHSVACGEYPDCAGQRYASVRVIPRLGLEFGHGLRWRPSVEADLGRNHTLGVLATFTCAYAW